MTPPRPGVVSAARAIFAANQWISIGPIPANTTITSLWWLFEARTQFIKGFTWTIGFAIVGSADTDTWVWTSGAPLYPLQSDTLLLGKPAILLWSIRPRSMTIRLSHDILAGPVWILGYATAPGADSMIWTATVAYAPSASSPKLRDGSSGILAPSDQPPDDDADNGNITPQPDPLVGP